MRSRLSTIEIVLIFIMCLSAIFLVFTHYPVHAQDVAPKPAEVPHFYAAIVEEDGSASWAALNLEHSIKLYCYNGEDFTPCQVLDRSDDKTKLALGPITVDEKPAGHSDTQDKPKTRTARN